MNLLQMVAKIKIPAFHGHEYLERGEIMPFVHFVIFIYKYKLARTNLQIMKLVAVNVLILETILILRSWDKKTLLLNGPYYLILACVSCLLYLCLLSYNTYKPHIRELRNKLSEDFAQASNGTKTKVLQECRMAQFLFIMDFALITAILFFYLYVNNSATYIKSFQCFIQILPSGFFRYVQWFTPFFVILLTAPLSSCKWYIAYIQEYQMVQIIMLNDKVQMLNNYPHTRKNKRQLIHDHRYQEDIKEEFKKLIQGHQLILSYSKFILETSQNLNILIFIASAFSGISPILLIYSPSTDPLTSTFTLLGFLGNTFITSWQGQHFMDEYKALADSIYNLDWYVWNNNNMKKLLILLQNVTAKPLGLAFPAYFPDCSYELFKSVVKQLYALDNALRSIQRKG